MCERMRQMSEDIRKEKGLPEGALIPLLYHCQCPECKGRIRC